MGKRGSWSSGKLLKPTPNWDDWNAMGWVTGGGRTKARLSPGSPTSRDIAEIGRTKTIPLIGTDRKEAKPYRGLTQMNAGSESYQKQVRRKSEQPRAAVPHEHR
jgi:hypothetical protein